MDRQIYFSIIVPCYNEEHRIADTVNKLKEFLLRNPGSEVIFVNDGSFDRTSQIIDTYMCRGMMDNELLKIEDELRRLGNATSGA